MWVPEWKKLRPCSGSPLPFHHADTHADHRDRGNSKLATLYPGRLEQGALLTYSGSYLGVGGVGLYWEEGAWTSEGKQSESFFFGRHVSRFGRTFLSRAPQSKALLAWLTGFLTWPPLLRGGPSVSNLTWSSCAQLRLPNPDRFLDHHSFGLRHLRSNGSKRR